MYQYHTRFNAYFNRSTSVKTLKRDNKRYLRPGARGNLAVG